MGGCVLVKFPCVLIISALFLSGCGDSKIREMRSEFVDGCKSSGMKMDVCSCVFSKMQEEYTRDQLLDMKIGVIPNGLMDFLLNLREAVLEKIDYELLVFWRVLVPVAMRWTR